MPVISMLTFFGTFVSIVLIALFIILIFYNAKTKTTTDRFILQANKLKPIIFKNIKLRYWITRGFSTQISPNNHCDLYLFDNCLAIVRRQDFLFKFYFAPVLIASDIANVESMFNYLDIYKPQRIHFNQIVKGEIDINITDPVNAQHRIDITFKELSDEQLTQLKIIKTFC